MFRVGQRVVCVDDVIEAKPWRSGTIVKGEVYTITAVYVDRDHDWVGYHLAEMRCRSDEFFDHEHFRPLQEKGMEMLRAILVHPNSPVKEDA